MDELKNVLQMEDDLDSHFFEVGHFMDRCIKFKHKMEAVMATHKTMYEEHAKDGKAVQ